MSAAPDAHLNQEALGGVVETERAFYEWLVSDQGQKAFAADPITFARIAWTKGAAFGLGVASSMMATSSAINLASKEGL